MVRVGSVKLLVRNFRRLRSEEHTSELQSLRHLVCRLLLDLTIRSEEHTSELQSLRPLVCRLLLEKKHPPPPGIAAPFRPRQRRTQYPRASAPGTNPIAHLFFLTAAQTTRVKYIANAAEFPS